MSERDDFTDHGGTSALGLLERAGELSPPMGVAPEAILAAGRRKVRRRRASAVGAGTATLALAGALWVGGPLDPFTDPETVAPAAISWHDGVDVDLFDNQPHPGEGGRTHWTGELRSSEGDALPELVLTRDGTELEPIPAQDGPGEVMIFRAEGVSVAAWERPTGSIGEVPVWSPGSEAGQGSSIEVGGGELKYAVAEFVPGATGELQELYWFSKDAGHAASGANVSSAAFPIGDSTVVVMVDEARGLWGTADDRLAPQDNSGAVVPLRADSGMTGWVTAESATTATGSGPVLPNASLGLLPPGADLKAPAEGVMQLQAEVGQHTAVLASDPTSTYAPSIHFSLDGKEHNLRGYAARADVISAGGKSVQVDARPDGLQLFLGPGETAVIPDEELEGGRAVVGAIGGGQIVVVPGWEPGAEAADLRVQSAGAWLPVDAALATTQLNGTPLMVLGLNPSTLADGATIEGVGVVDGDEVTPHEPKGGLSTLNLDL
ncbi:hypothetical protein [Ornithinimicrobium murale]|uniref:hypothetical protein n=1 Tax=Ornithinimicrobium murale TaxID=1050153 RepID=UPI000E0CEA6D|nr:hypothetical protein [Ornithinimicrobium murale]